MTSITMVDLRLGGELFRIEIGVILEKNKIKNIVYINLHDRSVIV